MSVFLGIGMGPIQTGIFLSGAARGGFDRLVVADVDRELVAAIRKTGSITINIAGHDRLERETIGNIEIYNPAEPADLEKLIEAAAVADEISTALPGVRFFHHIAEWLRLGFRRNPQHRRFIYTAENDNYAAEKLTEAVGEKFANTYYLNTVVGKMSKVFEKAEPQSGMASLCPEIERGHLVEEFNRILISPAPGVEERKTAGLHVKNNLYPFEEAKLYGHNAVHFLLGWQAAKKRLESMHQLAEYPEILEIGRKAFGECGRALCAKWKDTDELFTAAGFDAYAEDLLTRMCNPYLQDRVDRVIRDLPRKLAAGDRVMGTIRMCLEQDVVPAVFIGLAAECLEAASQSS